MEKREVWVECRCLNRTCSCHTTAGRVSTPFPMDFGPCYCCSRCASTRVGMLKHPGTREVWTVETPAETASRVQERGEENP
jgi:hypothetical protein